MIYVYALTDPAGDLPPGRRGMEDQPLRSITIGAVSATFTCHAGAPIPPVAQNLWLHEQVVESFMRHPERALLPARFATTFPGEAPLAEVLARHQAALTAGLERVRGCVELGLRVATASPATPPGAAAAPPPPEVFATGRAYMAARLADERRRRDSERITEELDQVLSPLARETVRRSARAADVIMSSAYLVHSPRAADFAARVRDLAAARTSLRLLCTGPWPAYHFSPSVKAAEACDG